MKIGLLSIVIPCFNEEGNLNKLISELTIVLESYSFSYEIICVDDGSSDDTFKILKKIAKENNQVFGFSLSRNFGHQIALLAGLQESKGDAVITMDADMQHPPTIIPKLIEKYIEGFDIVNTVRVYDKSTTIFKKLSSKWFYSFINKISDVRIEPQSSDFRLMNREAVDAFLALKERNRFTRGLIKWIGYNQTAIEYQAQKRFSGTSAYSLKKMISLAIDGVTSMSAKPLRLSLYFGFILFLAGIIYSIIAISNYYKGVNVEGWTSILITVLVIGGIQLLILSIIGEYISKIFYEAKDRPHYLIKSKTSNLD